MAEEICAGIDMAHIGQHPRPQRHLIQRGPVARQRRLAFGAADQVVPGVVVELLAGFLDELVQDQVFFLARLVAVKSVAHRGLPRFAGQAMLRRFRGEDADEMVEATGSGAGDSGRGGLRAPGLGA